MTIRDLINMAVDRAGRTEENVLASEVLLAYCLNIDRRNLFMEPGGEVAAADAEKFIELFGRFFEGEPVAYLVNRKEFYGLDFYVDGRVLIPRPETELLVDEVLRLVHGFDSAVKILDIGTGSGCIAVALAKKLKNAVLTATDISGNALEVARKNAGLHGVANRIDFMGTDLMDGMGGFFDFVVANLPYIGEKKFNFISREAQKYEPHVALFGGDDGFGLYEKLFKQLSDASWKPKYLLGEFGFLQGGEMRSLLEKYFGGQNISIIKDYASIERIFVVGFNPPRTSEASADTNIRLRSKHHS